jgi:hypothetical protein
MPSHIKIKMEGRAPILVDIVGCHYVADLIVIVRRAFGLGSYRLSDIQLCDFGNAENVDSVDPLCCLDPFLELSYLDMPFDVVLTVVIKPSLSTEGMSARQEALVTKRCIESLVNFISLALKDVKRASAVSSSQESDLNEHGIFSSNESISTRSDAFRAPSSATIRYTDEELIFLRLVGQIIDVALLVHELRPIRPTALQVINNKKTLYIPETMKHLEETIISIAVKSDIVDYPGQLDIQYLQCSAFETSILD